MARSKVTPPAVIEERVNFVYGLLLSGATSQQVKAAFAKHDADQPDKAWNVSARTIRRYVKTANGYIEQAGAWKRELEMGRAIARLNDIYARSMRVQDYQRALAAQRELNLIFGLHAPPPVQTLRLLGVSDAQLRELAKLLEEQGINASDAFEMMMQELAAEQDAKNKASS